MSSFHIRPRFTQVVKRNATEVQQILKETVAPVEDQFEVKEFPDFFCLRISERDRHFWSPRLNLSLEEEDGKTTIHGIYGPNANAWSLFLFSYLILGFLGLIAGALVLAQWIIGSELTWMWGFGGAMGGIGLLYIIAQFGQKLGAQQMFLLHQTYENAMGEHVEIH